MTATPPFYLTRTGGLGDVAMALSAAKAIKRATGASTAFITAPAYRALALACPHVDHVLTTAEEARAALPGIRASADAGRVCNLDPVGFGIAPGHQVDAFLEAFGLEAPAADKGLDLRLEGEPQAQAAALLAGLPPVPSGRSRILLHPAAGDPNRSWPLAHWTVLAQALLAAGHQVIRVGHGSADPHRSLLDLTVPGLLDGANRLDPLAFAALCQRADLLVSTDSGPVQLAGATEIALVGIYTVAPGRYRLPFRHGEPAWRTQAVEPSCPCFPCYQLMHDPEIMAPFEAAIREGILTTPELFSEWCVMEEPFRCLEAEILPERVLEACLGMLG